MTGQEKGDLLIQVTAWAGLIVYQQMINYWIYLEFTNEHILVKIF